MSAVPQPPAISTTTSVAVAPAPVASAAVAAALVAASDGQGAATLPQGAAPLINQPALLAELVKVVTSQGGTIEALLRQPLALSWQQGQVSLQPANQPLPAVALPRTAGDWLLPLLAALQPASSNSLAATYRRPQAAPELWPNGPLPASEKPSTDSAAPLLAKTAAALAQGALNLAGQLRWQPPAPLAGATAATLSAANGVTVAVPLIIAKQLPPVATSVLLKVGPQEIRLQPLADDGAPMAPINLPTRLVPQIAQASGATMTALRLLVAPAKDGQSLQLLTQPAADNNGPSAGRGAPSAPASNPPAKVSVMPSSPTSPPLQAGERLPPQPLVNALLRWPAPLPLGVEAGQPVQLKLQWQNDGSLQLKWQQEATATGRPAEGATGGERPSAAAPMPPQTQVLAPAVARQIAQLLGLPQAAAIAPPQLTSDEPPIMDESVSRALWRQQNSSATILDQMVRTSRTANQPAVISSLLEHVSHSGTISGDEVAAAVIGSLQLSPTAPLPITQSPLLTQVAVWLQLLLGARTPSSEAETSANAKHAKERLQQWLTAPEVQHERDGLSRMLLQLTSHHQLHQSRTEETPQGLQLPFSLPVRDDQAGNHRQIEGEAKQHKDEHGRHGWQLRLRLPVGDEAVLAQVQLFGKNLELLFVTSSPLLAARTAQVMPLLTTRLEAAGIVITSADCRAGQVPATLARCPHRLVEILV